MEIIKGIKIIDLCMYIKKEKILVISDLHIGYEEALNKQGVFVPRFQFKDTMERLKKIVDSVEINKIIILGDLKHEFGTISETEWKQTLAVFDLFETKTKNITLIKGNHDTILGPIARKKNLQIVNYEKVDDILFIHGDKILNDELKDIKTIIIGHEHPAVTLREKAKKERFKCFLLGSYKRKKLIVMPSFNLVTTGTDILKERLLSPYLKDISNFEVFVIENEEVYDFGKIKGLK